MITEKEPTTWQELQEWTAQILTDCGIPAETEVSLKTVRGIVEIDVIAEETIEGRSSTILVECKNWKSRVPQGVVHGFRTVVHDIGANSAYIISKAGFQSGAYEAAQHTNIQLLTWWEFQRIFEDQWYWTYLTNEAVERLDALYSYLEPIPAMAHWDQYLDAEDVERLKTIYHDNLQFGALIFALQPFMAMLPNGKRKIQLPLGAGVEECGNLPAALRERTGYREFLAEIIKYGDPLLEEFRSFRDKALARKAELGEA